MNMEMHTERSPRRTVSSAQLRFAHQAFMVLQRDIATCEVTGIEHIADIPDEPYEVAVSHSTGFDVPMTIHALGRQLDLAVGDQSTHHSPRNEPGAYFWLHVCGKRNYLPISYEWRNGQKHASRFDPDDAEPMVQALNKGKSVMIAAHNPLMVDRDGTAIPPQPGVFAPYVARRADAPILPVGVSYTRVDETSRYSATIRIGAPFELSSTVDTAMIRELDGFSRRGLTDESEEHQLREEIEKLKQDGRVVLDAVQALQDLSQGYPVIDNAYSYTEN